MSSNISDLFSNPSSTISITSFVLNFILSGVLATGLRWIYINYGKSLSNKHQFSGNFYLLTMTTMLIITVVKSSLALSLGLVGALSIIRFRTAIKEPEELAYLFLAISFGLGLGADQTLLTLTAFLILAATIIGINKYTRQSQVNQNMVFTVQSDKGKNVNIEMILTALKKHCTAVDLRRLDETEKSLEASFIVEALNFENINSAKQELQAVDPQMVIRFLDNKGLIH